MPTQPSSLQNSQGWPLAAATAFHDPWTEIGIMENRMETAIVYWGLYGNNGKMETTIFRSLDITGWAPVERILN